MPTHLQAKHTPAPTAAPAAAQFSARGFEEEAEQVEEQAPETKAFTGGNDDPSPPSAPTPPDGGSAPPPGEGAPSSNFNFLDMPLRAEEAGVQAKLTMGQPGDRYEREADQTAAQVMRMPDPQVSDPLEPQTGAPQVQQKCSKCEAEQKQSVIQRQGSGEAVPTASLQARLASQAGKGSPLSESTRLFMEPRFGNDFSGVRVHTDAAAAQMNQELGAQAFTHGNDIYFNSGKYSPETSAGKELLAHELTHTIQQMGEETLKTVNPERSTHKLPSGEKQVIDEPLKEAHFTGDQAEENTKSSSENSFKYIYVKNRNPKEAISFHKSIDRENNNILTAYTSHTKSIIQSKIENPANWAVGTFEDLTQNTNSNEIEIKDEERTSKSEINNQSKVGNKNIEENKNTKELELESQNKKQSIQLKYESKRKSQEVESQARKEGDIIANQSKSKRSELISSNIAKEQELQHDSKKLLQDIYSGESNLKYQLHDKAHQIQEDAQSSKEKIESVWKGLEFEAEFSLKSLNKETEVKFKYFEDELENRKKTDANSGCSFSLSEQIELPEQIEAAASELSGKIQSIEGRISKGQEIFIEFAQNNLEPLKARLSNIGNWLIEKLTELGIQAIEGWNWLESKAIKAWRNFKNNLENAQKWINDKAESARNRISDKAESAQKWISDKAESAQKWINDKVKISVTNFRERGQTLIDQVTRKSRNFVSNIRESGNPIFEWFGDRISRLILRLENVGHSAVSNLSDGLELRLNWLGEQGKYAIDWLSQNAKESIDWLENQGHQVVKSLHKVGFASVNWIQRASNRAIHYLKNPQEIGRVLLDQGARILALEIMKIGLLRKANIWVKDKIFQLGSWVNQNIFQPIQRWSEKQISILQRWIQEAFPELWAWWKLLRNKARKAAVEIEREVIESGNEIKESKNDICNHLDRNYGSCINDVLPVIEPGQSSLKGSTKVDATVPLHEFGVPANLKVGVGSSVEIVRKDEGKKFDVTFTDEGELFLTQKAGSELAFEGSIAGLKIDGSQLAIWRQLTNGSSSAQQGNSQTSNGSKGGLNLEGGLKGSVSMTYSFEAGKENCEGVGGLIALLASRGVIVPTLPKVIQPIGSVLTDAAFLENLTSCKLTIGLAGGASIDLSKPGSAAKLNTAINGEVSITSETRRIDEDYENALTLAAKLKGNLAANLSIGILKPGVKFEHEGTLSLELIYNEETDLILPSKLSTEIKLSATVSNLDLSLLKSIFSYSISERMRSAVYLYGLSGINGKLTLSLKHEVANLNQAYVELDSYFTSTKVQDISPNDVLQHMETALSHLEAMQEIKVEFTKTASIVQGSIGGTVGQGIAVGGSAQAEIESSKTYELYESTFRFL